MIGSESIERFSLADGFVEVIKQVNTLGEFAVANRERVEDVQDRLTAIREGQRDEAADKGDRIPIPEPQKLSGEDSSVDIRLRLKQIERYLKAKKRSPSEWGGLAFAFVEKSAESVWSSELTELENSNIPVTVGSFYWDNDFIFWHTSTC